MTSDHVKESDEDQNSETGTQPKSKNPNFRDIGIFLFFALALVTALWFILIPWVLDLFV